MWPLASPERATHPQRYFGFVLSRLDDMQGNDLVLGTHFVVDGGSVASRSMAVDAWLGWRRVTLRLHRRVGHGRHGNE